MFNLRAVKRSDCHDCGVRDSTRSPSVRDPVGSCSPDSVDTAARLFSSSALSRRLEDERPSTSLERPSTAPSRPAKSRSMTIEQLKNSFLPRKQRQPAEPPEKTMPPPLPPPPRPLPLSNVAQAPTARDKLKSQLFQYFKNDKHAGPLQLPDSNAHRLPRRSPSKKKDGPMSIFRTKLTNAPRGPEQPCPHEICIANKSCLCGQNALKQMVWQRDSTAPLSTYSLKPKPDVAPAFPGFATRSDAQDALPEDETGSQDLSDTNGNDDDNDDAKSSITALPPAPVHMVCQISSSQGSFRPAVSGQQTDPCLACADGSVLDISAWRAKSHGTGMRFQRALDLTA